MNLTKGDLHLEDLQTYKVYREEYWDDISDATSFTEYLEMKFIDEGYPYQLLEEFQLIRDKISEQYFQVYDGSTVHLVHKDHGKIIFEGEVI